MYLINYVVSKNKSTDIKNRSIITAMKKGKIFNRKRELGNAKGKDKNFQLRVPLRGNAGKRLII